MGLKLKDVTAALQEIAPLEHAEEWDNVGLLIEPSKPKPIQRILLTIDLTEAVLDEAIKLKSQMVVAYHPPIFEPLKRFYGHAILTKLIRHDLAVYSPHTALDNVLEGVNDWIAGGLGELFWKQAILSTRERGLKVEFDDRKMKVVVFVPPAHVDKLREVMAENGGGDIRNYSHCSFNIEGEGTFLGNNSSNPAVGRKGVLERVKEVRIEMITTQGLLWQLIPAIREAHPYEEPAIDIYPLEPEVRSAGDFFSGQGRLIGLYKPLSLNTIVRKLKRRLGISRVRVAASKYHLAGHPVGSIAICAGAGGSVLKQWRNTCLYITGEMRHHDILAANAHEISVILCDHTNTERGYLPTLKKKMHEKLGKAVRIDISKADREPLQIV